MTSTAFELDRFVLADERLEVTGRWVGIRGRRFVRPSLIAVVDGHSKRALADLEHKPWAAEDGDRWTAAFRWTGPVAGAHDFELAVAPDLAVRLPPPKKRATARGGMDVVLPTIRPEREREREAPARPGRAVARRRELGADRDRRDTGRHRVAEDRERGAAERDGVAGERDGAVAERDRALAERDGVVAERDRAVAERDGAVAERDRALAERDRLQAERDAAQDGHDRAVTVRDAAIADRERAIAERNDAVAAREVVALQLERARAELNQSRRDVAVWQRALSRLRNEAVSREDRRAHRSRAERTGEDSMLSTRLITIAAIAGVLILLLIIFTSGVITVAGH